MDGLPSGRHLCRYLLRPLTLPDSDIDPVNGIWNSIPLVRYLVIATNSTTTGQTASTVISEHVPECLCHFKSSSRLQLLTLYSILDDRPMGAYLFKIVSKNPFFAKINFLIPSRGSVRYAPESCPNRRIFFLFHF